jgi:4-hydroxy-2-oxoheptanedioate aldolase
MSLPSAVLPPNAFKAALKQHRPQIGIWSVLSSNVVAEILSSSGFDWILIDTEHAHNEAPDVFSQLQVMAPGSAEPMVRCAWNDNVAIKRILDAGGRSVMVPFVQNAAEARKAVSSTRYPPRGHRGVAGSTRATRWGTVADYYTLAEREVCVVVQVETRAALEAIEDIAAIDGVDGIFVGPNDLAADMGHLGNVQHPDVQAALANAGERIRRAGPAAGILTSDPSETGKYLAQGYSFIAVGSDAGILVQSTTELAARCKRA